MGTDIGRRTGTRLLLGLILMATALILSLLPTQAARAAEVGADPIVGDWALNGGVIRVTGSGGSFDGTIIQAISLAGYCTHPVGQHMWTLTGGNGSYSGTHIGFETSDCSDLPMSITLTLSEDILHHCTPYGCGEWTRVVPADATPPRVILLPFKGFVRASQGFVIEYSVTDDSRRAKVTTTLMSDGSVVLQQTSPVPTPARGRAVRQTITPPSGSPGPFYMCVSATDPTGNASVDAPLSACRWLSVQVPLALVSNGCGGAQWGAWAASAQNWFLNEQEYGGIPVSFTRACDAHDAGYSGVTVFDPFRRRLIDYRTWSRARVDAQFFDDIGTLCRRRLAGRVRPSELHSCVSGPRLSAVESLFTTPGASAYYHGVRDQARDAYDANATVPGVQTEVPNLTIPAGGARDNA